MSDDNESFDDETVTDALADDQAISEHGVADPTTEPQPRPRPSGDHADAAERLRKAIKQIQDQNRSRIGTLTLHTALRDIELTVDGDAALRAIAMFAGKTGYHDELTPEMDSAYNGWLGIDFDHLVAISWTPVGGDRRAGRLTLDPST